MTSLPTGIFLYPWDARDEGPDRTVATVADLGFDGVLLNVAYHSGRFMHPRHTGGREPWFQGIVNHRTGSSIAFQPDLQRYGRLTPVVDDDLVRSAAVADTVRATRDAGRTLDLWIVAMHASTLGERHPDRCVVNAHGDRYRYALCPADPDVRTYAVALVEDACAQFQPDAVVVETPNYLGFVHGDHHELIMESLDDATRWLLSLCFHPASQARGEAAGIDVDALRQTVVRLTRHLIDEGRGRHPADFRLLESASMLLEHPDLYAYVRTRMDTVTTLVEEMRAAAARHGAKLRVTSSIFERPASRAWAEATNLRDLGHAADELAVVSYFPPPDLVRADLEWVRAMAPDARLHVALNGGLPDAQGPGDMIEKAQIAAEFGATGISVYNYGLLTQRRLDWLKTMNQALGKEVAMGR